MNAHDDWVCALAASEADGLLVSGGRDGRIKLGVASSFFGRSSSVMACFHGMLLRLPRDRYYDGRDLSAVLFDRSHHHHTSMLCFGAKVSEGAVRVGRWKVMLVGKAERVYDVDADPRERKDLSAHKGAPRNLTHGERYLLLRAGWKPSMPFVPPLKKAAKVLWKEWKDSRELEGHWITDAKPPGMHALSRDGRGGCKASPDPWETQWE